MIYGGSVVELAPTRSPDADAAVEFVNPLSTVAAQSDDSGAKATKAAVAVKETGPSFKPASRPASVALSKQGSMVGASMDVI